MSLSDEPSLHEGPRSLLRPPPEVIPLGMRAMKMVGSADGPLRPGARRLMEAAQRTFLGVTVELGPLPPITPAELAAALPAELGRQLISAMVVVSLADGPPTPATVAVMREFATALHVDEPAVDTVRLFAEGHLLLGTLDYHRRSHLKDMLGDELESRGLLGTVKSILGLRGLVTEPQVAEPFLALGELPEGTLGRAFFAHYRDHGFAFPGEKGGFPEAGVYHDVVHVLAGYGTDPLGELQVGAFTAGFRKAAPLHAAMLPLLVFVANINVTPIPHDEAEALFARPDVAERFIAAYERGARVPIDLSDRWNFWPLMGKPLEAARRELGLA